MFTDLFRILSLPCLLPTSLLLLPLFVFVPQIFCLIVSNLLLFTFCLYFSSILFAHHSWVCWLAILQHVPIYFLLPLSLRPPPAICSVFWSGPILLLQNKASSALGGPVVLYTACGGTLLPVSFNLQIPVSIAELLGLPTGTKKMTLYLKLSSSGGIM